MGGGPESRYVGRVYGLDGAVPNVNPAEDYLEFCTPIY